MNHYLAVVTHDKTFQYQAPYYFLNVFLYADSLDRIFLLGEKSWIETVVKKCQERCEHFLYYLNITEHQGILFPFSLLNRNGQL